MTAAGIDPRRLVVTTLDADTRPDPCYLAALTYAWCTVPDRHRVSFQPIALYVSNAWDVPAPCRVVAAVSSLWNVVLSRRPRLIRNFSAHAQGLAALMAMDFWSVRTVVEDGHHFWRSWFHLDGRYRVEVSADSGDADIRVPDDPAATNTIHVESGSGDVTVASG